MRLLGKVLLLLPEAEFNNVSFLDQTSARNILYSRFLGKFSLPDASKQWRNQTDQGRIAYIYKEQADLVGQEEARMHGWTEALIISTSHRNNLQFLLTEAPPACFRKRKMAGGGVVWIIRLI